MSKSYKKHPIGGVTTADSEKQDKRYANRALRRKTKMMLRRWHLGMILPIMREVSNVWTMDKDGKRWHGWEYPSVWRK